ncbi:O-linked N-acetylglucosamine transferase, SPINDLY family protein [Rubrivivax rivuli]|uniref:protein O-GlcNAc transferase n=1 Tax=Rubrivivax rivuli TaxID=1862385 RepID=A0A437REB8_9BURK|nr:tetratricopeptide repeat protein [Rubrivivax rivuli]RVU45099.1 tetratricopeptide repeat protein [Rubrivivax rivuli]
MSTLATPLPTALALARSLVAQQRHAEAADAYLRALQLAPGAAALHVELAQCLRSAGRGEEATQHFERAVALEPERPQWQLLALLHVGTLLDEKGQTHEALATFEEATRRFPASADAWAVLGVVQSHLRSPAEAQVSLGRALQLDPSRIDLMERLARVLVDQKQFEDAAIVYEHMLRQEPGRPLLASWLLHLKYLMGDWLNIEALQARVQARLQAGVADAEPFGLQGWCADPALLRAAARAQNARAHPPRGHLLPPPALGRGTKLRIGYLAGEFREQATSVLLTEVLERHDAKRFEVHAFDNGWDDGSARRRRIEAACRVHTVRGLSDLEAARLVRAQGIDILVNLNGFFGLARTGVFSMRAAPLQVNYLGFPGTLGAPYIDYLIADSTVIPAAERAHYDEAVVTLPYSYQPNDSTRPIAAEPARRADAGLPEQAFVFCCLNNAYKILPPVFDVWMRLLLQVPGSVLLLYGDKPELQANLRHEAAQRGVAPERLFFAPPWRNDRHLRRLQLCDLFLDTWPYNAHTTGSDALWAGLPVLTCTGRSFPSRVGASLLQAVGLPELVTHDLESYEAQALRLATQPALLQALRTSLQARVRSSPLYDTARYTRELEAAYNTMAALARSGLPPQGFAVPASV